MSHAANPRALAPHFAARLAAILAGLRALIGRVLGRHPSRRTIINPLLVRLGHVIGNITTIMARFAAGRAPRRPAPPPPPMTAEALSYLWPFRNPPPTLNARHLPSI